MSNLMPRIYLTCGNTRLADWLRQVEIEQAERIRGRCTLAGHDELVERMRSAGFPGGPVSLFSLATQLVVNAHARAMAGVL